MGWYRVVLVSQPNDCVFDWQRSFYHRNLHVSLQKLTDPMNYRMETMIFSSEQMVSAVPDQVFSDLGDELAILSLKNGVYYGLNPAGALVWKLIQTPRTVGALHEALVSEYDVEPAQCEHDLQLLLHELLENGLIEVK